MLFIQYINSPPTHSWICLVILGLSSQQRYCHYTYYYTLKHVKIKRKAMRSYGWLELKWYQSVIPAYSIYSPTPTRMWWSILRLHRRLWHARFQLALLQQGLPITTNIVSCTFLIATAKYMRRRGGRLHSHSWYVSVASNRPPNPVRLKGFTPMQATNSKSAILGNGNPAAFIIIH